MRRLGGERGAWAAWERAQAARVAGDWGEALRWGERARRLSSLDPEMGPVVELAVAALRLRCGDAAGAAALAGPLARRFDAAAGWSTLASARLALGDRDGAARALARALWSGVVDDEVAGLAEAVAPDGWCGLGADRRVRVGAVRPTVIRMDGRVVAADAAIEIGEWVEVEGTAGPFLGSPLPLERLCGLRGFVEAAQGGLAGWAVHLADPARCPVLRVAGPLGAATVVARAAARVADLPPLARPRRFRVPAATLARVGVPVSIRDARGRALYGSPLDPGWAPEAAAVRRSAPELLPERRAVAVVMPVHGGGAATLACVERVLATLPDGAVLHVVDDASREAGLVDALAALAAAGQLVLHRHATNRGFPAAANTGIRAAAERDVVLLNSDTAVPPGWVERLAAAAYAAADIGSATPFSNDASILSYPSPDGPGEMPDAAALAALDGAARAANAGQVAEIPVGVGFCLYLRRDCLAAAGVLREDVFAQGYGEENDLCLRARRQGWRHVAALDLFVGHEGGRSFGSGRADLRRRNEAILNQLHPGWDSVVAAHGAADPLRPARRRIDMVRWAAAARPGGVTVLVTHVEGGGVAALVAMRVAAIEAAGGRAAVLIPAAGGCRVEGYDNLRFEVPGELAALAGLLGAERVSHVEVHHLLGHDHAVLGLAARLGVPVETWVHDAAPFCPRIALIGAGRRYCGEPEVAGCEACVAALGSNLREAIGPRALRARSAADLAASRRVVVPSADLARRLRRHFPAVRPEIVPWEDDRAWPAMAGGASAAARVCVVGAIGVEKGYDVLLAAAADAGRRGLPLEFVVCGHTEDDERLMAAGPVFVTGRYEPAEAVGLIRSVAAGVAWIPSIWPETWCFALSRAWAAGLPAVAFDLGAPAERIRATGRGWVLPLGLPVARVNDALLRLARDSGSLQPWREALGTGEHV